MKVKKVLLWTIGSLLVLGIAASIGFFGFMRFGDITPSTPDKPNVTDVAKDTQDVEKKVVNEPIDENVVEFEDGTNGHDFIAKYHRYYNDTLCWGKLEDNDYSYEEQRKTANEILQTLGTIKEINNREIRWDFESIANFATRLVSENDKNALRNLHRMFHDLDIYFNGYDYSQVFGVTQFQGNNK